MIYYPDTDLEYDETFKTERDFFEYSTPVRWPKGLRCPKRQNDKIRLHQHKYMDYCLDEFVFRFNRRKSKSKGKLFRRLIEQAVITPPVTREELKIEPLAVV